MILAGDIGGTKTNLAYFKIKDKRPVPAIEETVRSRNFATLYDLLLTFISAHRLRIAHVCLSIAGPVVNQRSQTPNLPWVVDAYQLAKTLDLPTIWLINDLEANARGISELEPSDFSVVHEGEERPDGNQAVISAGTGLGEAGLFWNGRHHIPFASEGGHADFAPTDATQLELLRYLMLTHEHVSYELVLSGAGLYNIYKFLRDSGRHQEPAWLKAAISSHDPAATIAESALAEKSPLCLEALNMFASIYGAEAGNLALKLMSLGGLFLGGGIAPKIIQKLKEPIFLKSMTDKGRMRALVESIPVKVIMNDKAALLGAARCAIQQLYD